MLIIVRSTTYGMHAFVAAFGSVWLAFFGVVQYCEFSAIEFDLVDGRHLTSIKSVELMEPASFVQTRGGGDYANDCECERSRECKR